MPQNHAPNHRQPGLSMGLLDKLFGEFIDIIEWTDDSNDTLVYRFERYGNEIKYGAKLTVRESQVAVLVKRAPKTLTSIGMRLLVSMTPAPVTGTGMADRMVPM